MTRKQFWPVMIVLIFAMMIAGCDSGSSTTPSPGGNTDNSKPGIYLGIIGFNDSLFEKNISLLENDTKSQFQSFVNGLGMEKGTALYYAVDKGIDKLQSANLRDDVINVSIITFTDGLDNVSIELNNQYTSRDAYRNALRTRISTVKFKDLPLTAYSIGMRGPDVTDVSAFTEGIAALASSGKSYEFSNMTEVNNTFAEIAASLSKESKSQSIKLTIPGGSEDGTIMRFTFDNIMDPATNKPDAARSTFFIEGTYKRSGNSRSLENVVYRGLSSDSGTTVRGRLVGRFVEFTFENVKSASGGSVSTDNAKQSEKKPSGSIWQINSEFEEEGDTETTTVKKSSVIILVLDCTTSLGTSNFNSMKSAANRFIDILLGN